MKVLIVDADRENGKAVAANGAFALELPPRSVICFGVMR